MSSGGIFGNNLTTVFFLISIVHLTYSSRAILGQLVVGEDTNCENEGQVVRVDFLKNNPCFDCICKNGKVQCQLTCKEKANCYAPVKTDEACCPKCQACRFGHQVLNTTTEWLPSHRPNSCERMYCKDGILTRAQLQCFVPCENPLPPSAHECCPTCSGCSINGTTYSEGETFSPEKEPCTKCTCQGGTVKCSREPCPVLACRRADYNMTKDGCCLECVGSRVQSKPPTGHCRYGDRIMTPGQRFSIDECTKCKCQDGTVICDRQTCEVRLKCPIEELVYRKGECCPICADDIPKDCFDAKGRKHKEGSFWPEGRDSCTNCSCANSTITCEETRCDGAPKSCPTGESLELVPGECCETCVREPDICSVFGDPHYRTFDGRPFNFQGDCRYIIAKDCKDGNFSVEVQNDAKTSSSFAWTKSVFVTLQMGKEGKNVKTISLHKHLLTRVNGKRISLPYVSRTLVITMERHIVKVRTKIGLSLNWDGDSFLEVGATESYKRQLCGLCGNYNGFVRDDFIGGDGSFKTDEKSFADSWKTEGGKCTRREVSARSTESCGRNILQRLYAQKSCLVFKSAKFQVCHDEVDPIGYYKSCLTDTCECPHSRKCSCESILAYTTACRRRGVDIDWNKAHYCPETCRGGKVYSDCGPSCVRTCANYDRLHSSVECSQKCVPGCHCPAGYVTYNRKCIRPNQCLKASQESKLRKRNSKKRRKRKRRRNRLHLRRRTSNQNVRT